MTAISALGRALLCGPIHAYRWVISPLFPGSCRFHPTCSRYALEAITQYGALHGLWLAVRRIARCHPRGGAGLDPVPEMIGSDLSPGHVPGGSGSSDHHHP